MWHGVKETQQRMWILLQSHRLTPTHIKLPSLEQKLCLQHHGLLCHLGGGRFRFSPTKMSGGLNQGCLPIWMSISNSSWTEVCVEGILLAVHMLGSPPSLLKIKSIYSLQILPPLILSNHNCILQ